MAHLGASHIIRTQFITYSKGPVSVLHEAHQTSKPRKCSCGRWSPKRQPSIPSFLHVYPTSPIKMWCPFPFTLHVGWPCDLLWTTKCGRSDAESAPAQPIRGLQLPLLLSYLSPKLPPQNSYYLTVERAQLAPSHLSHPCEGTTHDGRYLGCSNSNWTPS